MIAFTLRAVKVRIISARLASRIERSVYHDKKNNEIHDYDEFDTMSFINKTDVKNLADLGLKLPKKSPTTVISIRLPNNLLNAIRAYSTENDLPYQSLIKLFLQQEMSRKKLL
jgi:predicted DNA binding CopG/RHH family protein